jgi:hypothetical protein
MKRNWWNPDAPAAEPWDREHALTADAPAPGAGGAPPPPPPPQPPPVPPPAPPVQHHAPPPPPPQPPPPPPRQDVPPPPPPQPDPDRFSGRPPHGMPEELWRQIQADRQTLSELKATVERERTERELIEANPELRDPGIRAIVRERFEAARRANQALTASQFLAPETVKTDTVLSRLLSQPQQPPAPPTPPGGPGQPPPRRPPQPPPPNPERGAGGSDPAPRGTLTDQQVIEIARNPLAFRGEGREAAAAALSAKYGRPIGSGRPKRGGGT